MSSDILQGNWKQLKGLVKERWAELSDIDLDQIEGKRDQLLGKIQEKYGIAREQAESELEQFVTNLKSSTEEKM